MQKEKPFHHISRGIIVRENKVLVAHAIGYNNTFLPGGHVEFGESAKDALAREIDEELGVNCVVGNFLGLVEHKWKNKGIVNYEINQVFEIQCDELNINQNPKSMESHIEFFWCDANDLESENLQPHPLKDMIKSYLGGSKDVWWESTLDTNR